MLDLNDSLVIMIDMQERLVGALGKNNILQSAQNMLSGANILGIPIIVTEQYPKGLGNTVLSLPENTEIVQKTCFNALADENIANKIKSKCKKQILIFGIETHICVYQTACALLKEGFDVYVIKDACASRKKFEFKQGIEALKNSGVKIYSAEMALFEWLKDAKHPKFKEVQSLIK